MTYYAHSRPDDSPLPENSHDDWHLLRDHLREVALSAARKVAAFIRLPPEDAEPILRRMSCGDFADVHPQMREAYIAGLLHDIGKYSSNFQKRIEGKRVHVDHWSPGAYLAAERGAYLAALAVAGHHIGIVDYTRLKNLKENLQVYKPEWNISESLDVLRGRLEADGLTIPEHTNPEVVRMKHEKFRFMLATRMLFSALCDADFEDTERHFGRYSGTVAPPPSLKPTEALSVLCDFISREARDCTADRKVYDARQRVLRDCLNAAECSPGIFTLTAPTGSGKTLSSLAFAFQHAKKHHLRRVIFVIPYLSIIDQTVKKFRQVFANAFCDRYLLEDHSLAHRSDSEASPGRGDSEADTNESSQRWRFSSFNWAEPLVITTSVQFFESLFSNKPSACRKLHNIARSVIYLDEVQTFPTALVPFILKCLKVLTDDYGVSVVLGTATQPAFGHVRTQELPDWSPCEIIRESPALFAALRRVEPQWPRSANETISWDEVASEVKKHPQAMVVVNLKKHAVELTTKLQEMLDPDEKESLFHLSTGLCSAHRQAVLTEVKRRLREKAPVRLVATQCVEAGVDIDFPVVWRALGPLDAIAQAFGRCNREGNYPSPTARIFVPEDQQIPMPDYQQATSVAKMFLGRDLNDPAVFQEYFKNLYKFRDWSDTGHGDYGKLCSSIRELDFPQVGTLFRLIRDDTITVVVPYGDRGREMIQAFRNARSVRCIKELTYHAQPYTVNVYRSKLRDPEFLRNNIDPVTERTQEKEGWFLWKGYYDKLLGIFGHLRTEDYCV